MGRKTMIKSTIQNPKFQIPKLILYSQTLTRCTCYENIFNHEFETVTTHNKVRFKKQIQTAEADVGVICLCSAQDKDLEETMPLESLAGLLPLLTCSENLNEDFVSRMGRRGVQRFITCDMMAEKIRSLVYEAIKYGGLLEYIQFYYLLRGHRTEKLSPHIDKMIPEIVQAFPQRIPESEMAQRLGISRSYLWKLVKHAFEISYTRLLRRIWVHQALCLMHRTSLDNTEIALQLNYSEESNMARDFRKELNYSPGEARKLLIHHPPEELLHP